MPTYPLSFPAVTPNSEKLQLQYRQTPSQSIYTLAQQTINTASQWQLTWTWPQLTQGAAAYLHAWVNSLQGQVGTFYYQPHQGHSSLSGISLASPGYAYNTSAIFGGWSISAPSGLFVGQFFQIGEQLLQIVSAPINADGAGHCVVEFIPALRIAYTAGTAINFTNPVGKFRLATSDGFAPNNTPGVAEFGTLQAQEALE